ncbi:TPR repeat family protein [Rickettsia hoogstraalii str. RCCE3]|nr:TPR repeat family protein [Rickettsia hoogstraalii str. RCCE3]KJV80021.1 TPR repeat family protein [Rickettsia hoogstraalii str. RCCE3]
MKIIKKKSIQNIKKLAFIFILPLIFFSRAFAENTTSIVNEKPQPIDPQSKIQDPNILAEEYFNIGRSLYKLGKYEEAIKSYDLAIKYKSDYAESYLEKGIVLVNLGKHKEAKENFNLALKYKPNLIEEYEAIIKALRKLGNDLMADEFEEKLKIMQDNL